MAHGPCCGFGLLERCWLGSSLRLALGQMLMQLGRPLVVGHVESRPDDSAQLFDGVAIAVWLGVRDVHESLACDACRGEGVKGGGVKEAGEETCKRGSPSGATR